MKKNKKALILIYAIVLVTIWLSLAIIILNDTNILELNSQNYFINKKIYNNLNSKANQIIKFERKVNSDGSWWTDLEEWSWSNISCRLQADGSYKLEWDSGSVVWSDWIDDNCNDDNYKSSNSWTQDYPNWFEDNDELARTNINYIIPPFLDLNIFLNSKKIEDLIDSNSNNSSSWVKLWDSESWSLYLSLNTWAIINIFDFDKNLFNLSEEIKINNYYSWTISWSWYIKIIWKDISLDTDINNSYKFNFKNNWFLIFLKNFKKDYLLEFNLNWVQNWKKIYLTPIDDSKSDIIKLISYDVLKDNENFIFKDLEFEYKK